MKTYLINHLRVPGGIPNDAGLNYLEQVEATFAPFGGKWLAQGWPDVVEGAWAGSVILMEFPDRQSALAWYHSPAYQAILPLRLNNAISDIVLIDEVSAGFTMKQLAGGIRATIKPV